LWGFSLLLLLLFILCIVSRQRLGGGRLLDWSRSALLSLLSFCLLLHRQSPSFASTYFPDLTEQMEQTASSLSSSRKAVAGSAAAGSPGAQVDHSIAVRLLA